MTAPAFVLGSGLVTALGRGLPAHAQALGRGETRPGHSPLSVAGQTLLFHFASDPRDEGTALVRMIETAVADALEQSQLAPDAVRRMGIFVGSTSLDLPLHEAAYAATYAGGGVPAVKEPGYGNLARDIAALFGIAGPHYTLSTACSSSANAALYARAMIAERRIEHALVVGAEGYNRLSLLGFASMMLLSRSAYRPFDRARDGLILGEGVGAMVLGAAPRGGESRVFSITGAASACDPSSPTISRPECIAAVMREALEDAELAPGRLTAIKAHGTGTPSNDLAEGQAMRAVFGDRLPPLTSIKPYVGHTLGASGAIELVAMMASWGEGFLPATPGFSEPDEAMDLCPVTANRPLAGGTMLCNFFGFGGNNTSLVLAMT